MCLESEAVTPAEVVDHIRPHKGDESLFFDPNNLQSLCKSHHDREKKMMDQGKNVIRFDADGWPMAP